MNALRIAAALALATSLAACGLPLTSGAVSCGAVLGLDVYVDGVSVPAGVLNATPAMSCATALATVTQARDMGAESGFFGATQTFSGRVEFLNVRLLSEIGHGSANGETSGDDVAVAYGSDGSYTGPQGSAVLLTHEMLHLLYGERDHCGWAARYAPSFGQWQAGSVSGFDDECAHQTCNGAECKAD